MGRDDVFLSHSGVQRSAGSRCAGSHGPSQSAHRAHSGADSEERRIIDGPGSRDLLASHAGISVRMLESQAVTDLRYIGASPTPADVIRHNGIAECAKAFGKKLNRTSTLGTLITESGLISDDRFKSSSEDYAVLRSGFLDLLGDNNIRPEDFMEYEFRPLVTEVPPANSKKASRQLPRKTASTPERANQ